MSLDRGETPTREGRGTVKHCTQCGHVLGLGRFCTNCGHPVASRHTDPLSDPIDVGEEPQPTWPPAAVEPDDGQDWRTGTAERVPGPPTPGEARPAAPAVAPRLPPAVVEAPPPPRFQLFADEVVPTEVSAETPATPASPLVLEPVAPAAWGDAEVDADEAWDEDGDWDEDDDWDDDWDRGRRSRALRVVGAVVVLAALVLGAWLVGQALGGDDDAPASGDPSPTGSVEEGEDPVDHTAEASAAAPRTAPSTQDVDGNPTSYDASNMLDGVPETAWRVVGDGSGLKLVFTFPERTRISQVGLVNGYAKTSTDDEGTSFDWYAGHRRITEVTWNFGVGDLVRQDLEDGRVVQTIDVGPVEVRKIVLKIVATTDPGEGPARRDFTAISDVFLAG
jgi:hypothetical protein